MIIKGANSYNHYFSDFLNEVILDDWEDATLKIFFFWESTSFKLDHFYHDLNGERRKFMGSLNKRRISRAGIRKGIETLKGLTLNNNQEKWNVLEFKVEKNGRESLEVYWDEDQEEIHNPPVEPDEEREKDALLSSPEYLEQKIIIQDYSSYYSLKPFYYIKRPEVGVKSIVRAMIEEGSELDMVDFELIDFAQPIWQELEDLVTTRAKEDTDFRMMLDGDWDRVNKRFTKARFTYLYKGEKYPFNISL